jgi:hypothetical protein
VLNGNKDANYKKVRKQMYDNKTDVR